VAEPIDLDDFWVWYRRQRNTPLDRPSTKSTAKSTTAAASAPAEDVDVDLVLGPWSKLPASAATAPAGGVVGHRNDEVATADHHASASSTAWLGVDVGGANLKAVHWQSDSGECQARCCPFALWREPERLGEQLRELIRPLPPFSQVAVTMTGEIADCFGSKQEGVARIVQECQWAFESLAARVWYYQMPTAPPSAAVAGANPSVLAIPGTWPGNGPRLVTAEQATGTAASVAASNWHAVATLWGSYLCQTRGGPGLILDWGSTTLDLTPVDRPWRVPGRSDWQRLQEGTLVYAGARRSPLASVLGQVELEMGAVGLAHELFATIGDAYLLTGDLSPRPDDCATPDGRPFTVPAAAQRVARMFCSDAEELGEAFLRRVAWQAKVVHGQRIQSAIQRQLRRQPSVTWVLLLGEGERLLEPILRQLRVPGPVLALRQCWGEVGSAAAPAGCVAGLAALAEPT
jgi:probable H4MPT-linked C1 transfer pathway protein